MSRKSIKQILIDRDGMSPEDADDLITEAQEALEDYLAEGDEASAYNVCEEFFGLEPDYLDELL
jgi:hypothetical protein